MEIKLKHLRRNYGALHAVDDVSLNIPSNTVFGIIGRSGAGKSTLVRLISMLERPGEGEVYYDDRRVDNLEKNELIKARRRIGMIFQNFNLFASRNAAENIAYPMEICGMDKKVIKKRTDELLELVGLEGRGNAPISTLSGGQKQRVAIARALVNNPAILLADEPTGALDSKTGDQIMSLFMDLNEEGRTIVFVTHDRALGMKCREQVYIRDGKIVDRDVEREY